MKAMILAAGRGERMRPLTDTTPKPLLKVGGEPLIGWHLRRLKAAGIGEIVINHAWLGRQIEDTLGNGEAYGVKISYSPEGGKGLETAGGIATALPLLGNEPFLVINGDILTDIDFSAAHQAEELLAGGTAFLWLVDNPPHHPQGDFALAADGLVQAQGGRMLTFGGCGLYRPCFFDGLVPHRAAKLAPLLRAAMGRRQVFGTYHSGLWLDVGTVGRLAEAERLVSNRLS